MKQILKSLIVLTAAFVSLTGCSKVVKNATGKYDPKTELTMYAFGIRNPKIENKQSITEYAINNGMETGNLYAFRDSAALAGFYARKIGIPEIDIYNKDGILMQCKNEKKCNAQDDGLIGSLDPKNNVSLDSSHNLYAFLPQIRTLDNQEVQKSDFAGYDFYIIMYWAKWGGMMNKTHVPQWGKTIKDKTGLRIKVISLTADYMDYWHPNEKYMFKIYDDQFSAK